MKKKVLPDIIKTRACDALSRPALCKYAKWKIVPSARKSGKIHILVY